MFTRVLAVGFLACTLAAVASSDPIWTKSSPGGGGSFQTVDVAADGKVLVGSDLSGAYLRSTAGTWQRLGKRDGLNVSTVVAVAWKPGQSLIALAGTKKGLFRTADGGQTWTLTGFSGYHVSAIAWKDDVVYVSGASSSTNGALVLRKSSDGGQTWSSDIDHGIPTGRRAVKLAIDPQDPNEVWLLSGHDGYLAGAKELYRSSNGGANMAKASDDTMKAIDFALNPSNPSRALLSTSVEGTDPSTSNPKDDGFGFLYVSNWSSQGLMDSWHPSRREGDADVHKASRGTSSQDLRVHQG